MYNLKKKKERKKLWRKEIKKLIAATMSMALVLGVGNMVNSSAAEKKIAYRAFSF